VIKYLEANTFLDIVGEYNDNEWYEVNTMIGNSQLNGWIHSSIVDKIEINNSQSEPPQETKIISQSPKETQTTETNKPWYKKLANFSLSCSSGGDCHFKIIDYTDY